MLLEKMQELGPDFFDMFGVLAFAYVIFFAHMLLRGEELPRGFTTFLLLIGLAGLFIDIFFASSILGDL
ncbi:MAG: hypothetical protein U1C52_00105 [Patescibacteria group bacterium]|nr:hypothetical protein [Patescibacteria group bacterium]